MLSQGLKPTKREEALTMEGYLEQVYSEAEPKVINSLEDNLNQNIEHINHLTVSTVEAEKREMDTKNNSNKRVKDETK